MCVYENPRISYRYESIVVRILPINRVRSTKYSLSFLFLAQLSSSIYPQSQHCQHYPSSPSLSWHDHSFLDPCISFFTPLYNVSLNTNTSLRYSANFLLRLSATDSLRPRFLDRLRFSSAASRILKQLTNRRRSS